MSVFGSSGNVVCSDVAGLNEKDKDLSCSAHGDPEGQGADREEEGGGGRKQPVPG